MSPYLTATKYGMEWINHQFIKVRGTMVLKMIRPNGKELKTEDLR